MNIRYEYLAAELNKTAEYNIGGPQSLRFFFCCFLAQKAWTMNLLSYSVLLYTHHIPCSIHYSHYYTDRPGLAAQLLWARSAWERVTSTR